MDVGTVIDDQCVVEYQAMKGSKSLRFVVFVYDVNGRVVVDKTGKRDESYADFLECLPKNEARYAVFDFPYTTNEVPARHNEKLIFFLWSPDSQPVKTKMLYAAGKDALKKRLTGIGKEIQANGYDDLDEQSLIKELQG